MHPVWRVRSWYAYRVRMWRDAAISPARRSSIDAVPRETGAEDHPRHLADGAVLGEVPGDGAADQTEAQQRPARDQPIEQPRDAAVHADREEGFSR